MFDRFKLNIIPSPALVSTSLVLTLCLSPFSCASLANGAEDGPKSDGALGWDLVRGGSYDMLKFASENILGSNKAASFLSEEFSISAKIYFGDLSATEILGLSGPLGAFVAALGEESTAGPEIDELPVSPLIFPSQQEVPPEVPTEAVDRSTAQDEIKEERESEDDDDGS